MRFWVQHQFWRFVRRGGHCTVPPPPRGQRPTIPPRGLAGLDPGGTRMRQGPMAEPVERIIGNVILLIDDDQRSEMPDGRRSYMVYTLDEEPWSDIAGLVGVAIPELGVVIRDVFVRRVGLLSTAPAPLDPVPARWSLMLITEVVA